MKKIVRAAFKLAAFYRAGLSQRDPRLWVFGDKHSFGGNSHYLFLWVTHHEPEIEAVWITTDQSLADRITRAGLRAEVRGTPEAKRLLRRAGVFIFNNRVTDIGAAASNGALLVNLWHGSGLKTIGSHNKRNVLYHLRAKGRLNGLRAKYERIDQPSRAVFVSTSPAIAVRFSEAHDAPLSQCPICGTPRLDGTVDRQMRGWSRQFGSYGEFENARKANREIYVYMPTFRMKHRQFLGEAFPDPERLSDILRERSAIMFVKLHPQDESRHSMLEWERKGDRRILPWPRDLAFYNVIDQIDCLITDYSSVMFDFIAVKSAGVVLYPFDIDRYVDEKGFYFPYEESVVGHRVDTFSDLCEAIASGQALAEIEPRQLAKVRTRVWEGSKLPASPHVTAEIKRRVGLSSPEEESPMPQARRRTA